MKIIKKITTLMKKDNRYPLEAYLFVLEALNFSRNKFNKKRHVTGKELLEGIKEFGKNNYGAMSQIVFEYWGIKNTIDFGNIVFNMVNEKILTKTDEDNINDFKDVFDFHDVFVDKYQFHIRRSRDGKRKKHQ